MKRCLGKAWGWATLCGLTLLAVSPARAQVSSPWPMVGHDSSLSYLSNSAPEIMTPSLLWGTTIPWFSWYLSLDARETVYIGGKSWDNTSAGLMALNQAGVKWVKAKEASWTIFSGSIPLPGVNFKTFLTAAIGGSGDIFAATSSSAYISYGSGAEYCPECENNVLYALAPDGRLKWEADFAGSSSPPVLGPDGTLYIATRHGIQPTDYLPCYDRVPPEDFLFAYDPAGALKWSYSLGAYRFTGNPAVAADGAIYLPAGYTACTCSYPGSTCTSDYKLIAINPDGTLKWERDEGTWALGEVTLAADGTIYLGAGTGLMALSPANGAQKWFYPAGNCARALGPDGSIYLATTETFTSPDLVTRFSLSFLNALAPDGRLNWRILLTNQHNVVRLSNLTVDAAGRIYLVDNQGALYIYSPLGTLLFRRELVAPIFLSDSARFATVVLGQDLVYVYVLPYYYDLEHGAKELGAAKLMAIGNLFPPSSLRAMALPDSTIRLEWFISPTPTAAGYDLFAGTNLWEIDYTLPAVSLLHPSASFVTEPLAPGQYCFGLRAYGSAGEEETNTNVVACAIVPADLPVGLAAARIKSPRAGKKLSGELATVIAEVIGDRTLVKDVRFQVQFPGGTAWQDLPPANPSHPNPADLYPYYIHVNVASLPEGDYGLRAVATDLLGNDDPFPESIVVTIARQYPEEQEFTDGLGAQNKIARAFYAAPAQVVLADPDASRTAEVYLPELSLDRDETELRLDSPECPPLAPNQGLMIGKCQRIGLHSGQKTLQNGNRAELTISLPDEDNDGFIDGAAILESEVVVYRYNPDQKVWQPLPSQVDPDANVITAQTHDFSLFALGGKIAGRLEQLRVHGSANPGLFGCALGNPPTDSAPLANFLIPLLLALIPLAARIIAKVRG